MYCYQQITSDSVFCGKTECSLYDGEKSAIEICFISKLLQILYFLYGKAQSHMTKVNQLFKFVVISKLFLVLIFCGITERSLYL